LKNNLKTAKIQQMKINIIKDDPNFLVISKPAGISVHDGAGEKQYTIVDWLKENYPKIQDEKWLSQIRPGIVHRLDKETSGILLLAKNQQTLDFFQDQFKAREVEKHYTTLVYGKPPFESGHIDALVRRDPKDRKKQKVDLINFDLDEVERKKSATGYKAVETFEFDGQILSLIDVRIYTGRKHQIRVHMQYEGCPVMGDQTYFNKASKRLSKKLSLNRQFLHAVSLKIKSPNGETLEFHDQLPEEFKQILDKIK
jgi:23S rRNA pseudouridine1911/1915/1917 synthase